MGTNENLDVTHRLTVLGMDKIGILAVDVEEVLEHTQYETWDGKHLGKGAKS